MSTLRIVFEVDEKHVGFCLVALQGKAKNLNFEVLEMLPPGKNKPQKAPNGQEAQKLPADWIVELIKNAGKKPMSKADILARVKEAGFKVQGLNSILLSLAGKKRKILKKTGNNYEVIDNG